MIRIAALFACLCLALPASARAEWLARCQGGANQACFGEACGVSADDARARCQQQCPGSDTHSVGISSCKMEVQKPRSQTPRLRPAPAIPGDGASLR